MADDRDDDMDYLAQSRRTPPHNYLVESILVLMCCNQLFGILALVHAAQVQGFHSRGDFRKAEEMAASARMWCLIGLIVGVTLQPICCGAMVFLQIAGAR